MMLSQHTLWRKRNVTWYINIHCNKTLFVQAVTGRRVENYKRIPDVIPYFWSGNDILLHEFCCAFLSCSYKSYASYGLDFFFTYLNSSPFSNFLLKLKIRKKKYIFRIRVLHHMFLCKLRHKLDWKGKLHRK